MFRTRINYRVVFPRVMLGLTAFSILFGLIGSSRAPGAGNAESIARRVFDTKAVPKKVQAELPRIYMDTSYPAPKGNTLVVAGGGNLQEAINSARCGDVVK